MGNNVTHRSYPTMALSHQNLYRPFVQSFRALPECQQKMAARNKLICAVLLAVLVWGLYDILTNYEQNGCAMTYMYQMPEYLVSKIKLLSSIGNTMSKLTSLQLINMKTVDKLPNSAPCFHELN